MLSEEYKKQAFENLKTMSAEQMEKILTAIGSVKVEKQESRIKPVTERQLLHV